MNQEQISQDEPKLEHAREPSLSVVLENELGPAPEELEQTLEFTDKEPNALVNATADKAGTNPNSWRIARRKVCSRLVVTGLAIATLMPMMVPEAQAGERGRRWGKQRTSISLLAGLVGESVFAHKEREHMRNVRDMSSQLRRLETNGERIVRRMDRLQKGRESLEDKLILETDERHKEQIRNSIKEAEEAIEYLQKQTRDIDAEISESWAGSSGGDKGCR